MAKTTVKCPYCGAGFQGRSISNRHLRACAKNTPSGPRIPGGPTLNSETSQPVKERYFVFNDAGSLIGSFDNLLDAQYRASINPGARVSNVSRYAEPTLLQRLLDSRPDDADRKVKAKASKIRPVKTWHQVFDAQGKIVEIYDDAHKTDAQAHAISINGQHKVHVSDPNKPLWRRIFED